MAKYDWKKHKRPNVRKGDIVYLNGDKTKECTVKKVHDQNSPIAKASTPQGSVHVEVEELHGVFMDFEPIPDLIDVIYETQEDAD